MDASARRRFEQTALPHLDRLYGMALKLTRNRAEAEDLVQDTAVRAYRFWHTFAPDTSVRAWLFTILRNTFITKYHRKNRRRALASDLSKECAARDPGVATISAAPPSPDTAVDHRGTREKIDAALTKLPDDYQMAVTLADIEGLTYKEIAAIMECPIGTVMSRIYRGRKLLHKILHAHATELGLVEPPQRVQPGDPVSLSAYRKRGHA